MALDRDTIVRVLEAKLAPLIGESMARSSIKMHSAKLGLDGDALTSAQVNQLVRQIGLAMRVFVGKEKADVLAHDIMTAVNAEADQ